MNPQPSLRVLYAEDDKLVRTSTVRLLKRRLSTLVIDEVGTLEEALAALDSAPDRLLLDVSLGPSPDNVEGLSILKEARSRGIEAPAVILTGYIDFKVALEAQRYRGSYFPKAGVTIDELLDVLCFPPPPISGAVTKGTLKAMAEVLLRAEGNLPDKLEALRDAAVEHAFDVCNQSLGATARMLGVDRQYVQWARKKGGE
jgi:CheY-like chemotaxis protein